MKDEMLKIRVPANDKQEICQVAEALDVPVSQIVRDGIRNRIAELKRTDPRLQAQAAQVEVSK
jgi:antitoxin component of RelBE/YafQ-DinJ toxin-antitoxin module